MANFLCIGACGMGMTPLALYLRDLGHTLFLHDDQPNPAVLPLLQGNNFHWLKESKKPQNLEAIIYSSAIAPTHPLREWGTKHNIPQFARGVFLAKTLQSKRLIAIAGSHGKTTTTALLIHLLAKVNYPVSFLLGALWQKEDLLPAQLHSESDWVVAEIDESDGSILEFEPEISIVLNLDWDHPAHYTSVELLEATFAQFFQQTKGTILIPRENHLLKSLAEKSNATILHFDPIPASPYISSVNSANMGAALQCAECLSGQTLSPDLFNGFPGVKRRQECHLKTAILEIWGDYAHHPVEVEAFIKSMTAIDRKLIAIFQPHRYTRTAQYAKDFAKALALADEIFLLPVYAASEDYQPDGTVERIGSHIAKPFTICNVLAPEELVSYLNTQDQPITLCFIGAGDIEKLIHKFVKLLAQKGMQDT